MSRCLLGVPLLVLLASGAYGQSRSFVVNQREKAFSQESLRITPGDTVIFVNSDVVTHSVFSTSEKVEFTLRPQPPGGASAVVFQYRGTAHVRCAFHRRMTLTVRID